MTVYCNLCAEPVEVSPDVECALCPDCEPLCLALYEDGVRFCRCLKDRGHDGQHEYLGRFWTENPLGRSCE